MQRTYTPGEWNFKAGRTCIPVHLHSGGPGEQRARKIHAGDERATFGPRASPNIHGIHGAAIVFGDETSIGLIRANGAWPSVRFLLEVTYIADTRAALVPYSPASVTYILTGKVSSIQHLRRERKASGVSASKTLAKSYWVPGGAKLD